MQKSNLDPIKEEPSPNDGKDTANVVVLEPLACPCAKFFKARKSDSGPCDKSFTSILNKAFIFRRDVSLENALKLQERNLQDMYATLDNVEEMSIDTSSVTKTTSTPCTPSAYASIEEPEPIEKRQMEYLLKIQEIGGGEEKQVYIEREVKKEEKEDKTESEAMRMAQKYLRIHRIFEFYQFLIAHLLGNMPENPIAFLLDILDKCIIYRASMGQPPLLFEKKHIEALFNLMDPMKLGYIDLNQYNTGMKTLGVCTINPNPDMKRDPCYPYLIRDSMVAKETFIEEAYDNLVNLLNELLKRRWLNPKGANIAPLTTPPPTLAHLVPGGQGTRVVKSTGLV
nr:uncharacterized protein LOC111422337 [Onthophagus taurus]